MLCEICGRMPAVVKVSIEDSLLACCESCGSLGNKVSNVVASPQRPVQKRVVAQQPEEVVVDDFSALIKAAREKKQLSQEQLALAINERSSLLHKFETGHQVPTIALARKIEKFLGIRLVELVAAQEATTQRSDSQSLTIGDTIRIRKR